MYTPKIFEETRLDVLHALIQAQGLGTWVSSGGAALEVNHVPFVLDRSGGELGVLKGHVARANPIWNTAHDGPDDVVIFRGPHAYITPSWYSGKALHGKEVPTWNYAAVTIWGRPIFIEDEDWLYEQITELSRFHEADRDIPWAVTDAPDGYIRKLAKAIVGVEIPITRIEGKWKVSQNRTEIDKQMVVTGLTERGDDVAVAMATLVQDAMTERHNA